ncbi:expressed protein [Echinococcus multilocularis]|uniref:Expressed protein n=1 Tax=Echinococcus multilocularis TaxID=6211 RepID=A0A068YE53_ECHMU|nr:expressed protein [Echinococcus multilocularis]
MAQKISPPSEPPSSFERRPRRSRRSTSCVSHCNVVGAAKSRASHQISAQLRVYLTSTSLIPLGGLTGSWVSTV